MQETNSGEVKKFRLRFGREGRVLAAQVKVDVSFLGVFKPAV